MGHIPIILSFPRQFGAFTGEDEDGAGISSTLILGPAARKLARARTSVRVVFSRIHNIQFIGFVLFIRNEQRLSLRFGALKKDEGAA